MDNTDRRIERNDLRKIGYYFASRDEETIFINAINEELADRIARGYRATEPEIKEELIEELRAKRREVMLRASGEH